MVRHQFVMFILAFPAILLGTSGIVYNKWLHKSPHMTTWHGTFGFMSVVWLIFQVMIGGGSVWFNGSVFGGGAKAKAVWKYHRLSGYILLPLLLFTAHLGGAWSAWMTEQTSHVTRFIAYTIAPVLVVGSVYARIRLSKMKFL